MADQFTDFEVQVDLTEVTAWGGEERPLLPIGDYNLTVVGAKQDTSKTSQNAMIVVEFEVADGEYAGQKIWNNYSLSPKAIGRLKSLVVACGGSLHPIRASEWIGQTIGATVIHSEGAPKVDSNGQVMPSKTFANVSCERALGAAEEQVAAPAPTPPIKNKAAAMPPPAKPANGTGAPRRA